MAFLSKPFSFVMIGHDILNIVSFFVYLNTFLDAFMLKIKKYYTNKVDYNQYSKCGVIMFPNMFNKSKL